jgi:hypothetical protein
MARRDSDREMLILESVDRQAPPARPAWAPLFYALFATAMVMAIFAFVEWQKIPEAAKRDIGAARACQQHIRYKLPPNPALEIVDFTIQPSTGLPGIRSVMIAYRANGPNGKPIQGLQRCAFETDDDGNFPPFKDLSRAVFRSEMEMYDWKAAFLRGEPVAVLEPGRPDCCLSIDSDGPLESGITVPDLSNASNSVMPEDMTANMAVEPEKPALDKKAVPIPIPLPLPLTLPTNAVSPDEAPAPPAAP